jgi:hypothetical protein
VGGHAPDTNYELAVRAAGSVADFALRAGRSVNLLRHERSWQHTRLTADGGGRRGLLEALAEAQANAPVPFINALRHLHGDGPSLLRAQSVTVVCLSLNQQLVRALVNLRDDGVKLSVLYVPGASFARASSGAGALLPFLPPRDSGPHEPGGTPTRAPGTDGGDSWALPTEDKGLLVALASAGIPSITLEYGDDLVRTLSLWQTIRRHGATTRQARQ